MAHRAVLHQLAVRRIHCFFFQLFKSAFQTQEASPSTREAPTCSIPHPRPTTTSLDNFYTADSQIQLQASLCHRQNYMLLSQGWEQQNYFHLYPWCRKVQLCRGCIEHTASWDSRPPHRLPAPRSWCRAGKDTAHPNTSCARGGILCTQDSTKHVMHVAHVSESQTV